MDNIYYVYEWVRLDTNEPFYIGKGKNNRWKQFTNRNKHFINICNTVDVAVIILHDNLEEDEANDLERWYIYNYKYEIGYDIVNITEGGEGAFGVVYTEDRLIKNRESYNGFDIQIYYEEILKMYNDFIPAHLIGKKYNVSRVTIIRMLKRNGIEIRTQGETKKISQIGKPRKDSISVKITDKFGAEHYFPSIRRAGNWLVENEYVKTIEGGSRTVFKYIYNKNVFYKDLVIEENTL